MCGALTKLNLASSGHHYQLRMGISMLISYTCTECVSRVDHLASDNTPFETPFDS